MKISKIFGRIGGVFLPFRNIKKQIGWAQFKSSVKNVGGAAIQVASVEKTSRTTETYEEAVKRLNLTPEMLENRIKTLSRMYKLYLGVAAAFVVYAIYLLIFGSFLSVFITIVLFVVAVALAYREHFWYTQMKHKRLGLSFKDWYSYTLKGLKK